MGIFSRKPRIEKLKEKRDVGGLIKALDYDDPNLRRNAALALGEIGDLQSIEPLLKALSDKRNKLAGGHYVLDAARVAIYRIAEVGSAAAVPSLGKAVDNENNIVRLAAVTALGKAQDKRAGEFLIKALRDDDEFVRSVAADGLATVADERTVEPLLTALEDESFQTRTKVIVALGNVGDKRATEALIDIFEKKKTSGRYGIRAYVAEALGKIGDKRAAEPLTKFLREEWYPVYIEKKRFDEHPKGKVHNITRFGEHKELSQVVVQALQRLSILPPQALGDDEILRSLNIME